MLDEKDFILLKSILRSIPNRVYVYGSRVKGIAQPFSDIDLYIEGELSDEMLSNLITRLEESDLSIKVDIKNKVSADFLKLIQPDFVRFQYAKKDKQHRH